MREDRLRAINGALEILPGFSQQISVRIFVPEHFRAKFDTIKLVLTPVKERKDADDVLNGNACT